MSDWVPASTRTVRYAVVASALWAAGVITGLMSLKSNDAFETVSELFLMAMLVVSISTVSWSAVKCSLRSRLGTGWMLVAIGLAVALVSTGYMLFLSRGSLHYQFNGADPTMTLGFLIGGVGLAVGASGVERVASRIRPLLQASALAVIVFLVMLAALLAPGPGMPFSVGPRDVPAVWRLAIDCGCLLLPAVYATLAQLRLSSAHRARAWMWAAAGALVLAMGDVGAPLVDLGHGQLYPTMLWCLGVILLAGAASMTADFELAEGAGPAEGVGPTEGAEKPLQPQPTV